MAFYNAKDGLLLYKKPSFEKQEDKMAYILLYTCKILNIIFLTIIFSN